MAAISDSLWPYGLVLYVFLDPLEAQLCLTKSPWLMEDSSMLMTRLPACIRPISLIANCYLYTRELSKLALSFTTRAFLNLRPRSEVMIWLTLFLVSPLTSSLFAMSNTY